MPPRVPARILQRGRVTIPKEVRDELGLSEGDRVWLEVEPIDGDRVDVLYSHGESVERLNRDGE